MAKDYWRIVCLYPRDRTIRLLSFVINVLFLNHRVWQQYKIESTPGEREKLDDQAR